MHALAATAIGCFVVALVVCEVVRRVALQRALVDEVNHRSLHTTPTPRLGGLGIVMATLFGAFIAVPFTPATKAVVGLCTALACVGLRDDLKPLPASLRFVFQGALASAFLGWIGAPRFLLAHGVVLPLPSIVTFPLLVVWVVGVLNIYNFMDGMDGLAGSQTLGAAAVTVLLLPNRDCSSLLVMLAASSLGFLAHNAPPARMFMGDAGAYFVGMVFATVAIAGMHQGVPLALSALPLAPFLLDGTFTILRRLRRGEKIWQAHRSHLYQRAVQTGLEHRDVLLVYLAWIGACALAAIGAAHDNVGLFAGWTVALLGLVLVWRWVVRRENRLTPPAQTAS